MDENKPKRHWYRKKRWRAGALILAISSLYSPVLIGDAMYVAGRKGMSAGTAERLIYWGSPAPPGGGIVSRYQRHLHLRYGRGASHERRAGDLAKMLANVRVKRVAAEGARAESLGRIAARLEAEIDGGSDAPFWYR